ncbi:MAG: PHP domain-containing protein [Candidatus Thorarchaeota archaeon]
MPNQKYDLHVHSKYSDGTCSIADIIKKAKERRLAIIAITDHFWPSRGSQRGGLGLIRQRRREIEEYQSVNHKMRILDGAEVDILSDGELAEVSGGRDQFDLLIGSVHWASDSTTWASAVIRAASRYDFDILGHYDGYLTSYREEDGKKVAQTLADNDITVEISTRYPPRYESFLAYAKHAGCSFVFGSDAHMTKEIGRMKETQRLAAALGLEILPSNQVMKKFCQ